MKLIPYLHYAGNCEEALNHYKKVLDGRIEIVTRYDQPSMNAPEDYKNKVLHARFYFGDNTIFASDTFPGNTVTAGNAITLSLSIQEDKATEVFNNLAAGGVVTMPFERQFWGDLFGQLTDRFGIKWMVNGEK